MTYFTVFILVFYILKNLDLLTTKDSILVDTLKGKNILVKLTKDNIFTERYT